MLTPKSPSLNREGMGEGLMGCFIDDIYINTPPVREGQGVGYWSCSCSAKLAIGTRVW